MSRSTGRVVVILLAVLCLVVVAIAVIGGLWALAVLSLIGAAYFVFGATRLILARDDVDGQASLTPAARLRQELDNPDQIKEVLGSLIVVAVVIVVAIEEGSLTLVWILIPVVIIQLVWLAAVIIRKKRRES